MIIFTLRRFLLLLVTLFFLTFIGFSLSYFTPHAPLQGASLWNAWVFWFNGLIHWDFGVSSINGQLISEQLKEVFPATMELCILAFGFALMVGIPVGMLAGITRNKWQDRCISALALMGFSIPVFWLALLLTLLLHRVGIKDHKDAMRSFPYELTDGECQKVMIAIVRHTIPYVSEG